MGARSEDRGSGQAASLLGCQLRAPSISGVTRLIELRRERLVAEKALEGGYVEHVESPLPCVIGMEADEEPDLYASFPALLTAAEREIESLDLPRIGLSRQSIRSESRLVAGPLRFPVPKAQFTPAPDSSLPGFERRERPREGPIRKRKGKIVRGDAAHVAEELFQTLLAGGWLDHLRKA